MKKFFLLFFIAAVFFACKKDDQISSAGYIGTFELRARYGGIAGISEKYNPGNGNLVQFKADSTYQFFDKGSISKSGTFRIVKNFKADLRPIHDRIYYDNDTRFGEEIHLNGDTLTFGTAVTDNIATDFVRIKK